MELAEVVNSQYAFPVGIVLICAVFVFAFGFKSNPPTFSQPVYATDDRKTAGKKKKIKDKKSVQNNSSLSVAIDDGRKQKLDNSSKLSTGKSSKQIKSAKDELDKNQTTLNKQQPSKKKNISQKENVNDSLIPEGKVATKDKKQLSDEKKTQSTKDASVGLKIKSQEKRLLKEKNYNVQQVKTIKNAADATKPKSAKGSKSKLNEEKPSDFDDGEWEQAVSRKEKKSKRKDEETLMTTNAINSGLGSSPGNQSLVPPTPNNDAGDSSAPISKTGATNIIQRSGTDDHLALNIDTSGPVTGKFFSAEILNGENEKKEPSTKAANSGVSSSVTNVKPKSSKSKNKNKEVSSSLQKEATSLENENVILNVRPPGDESSKSKKKKKQPTVSEKKEAPKLLPLAVEPPKPRVEVREITARKAEPAVIQNIITDMKAEPPAAVVFDELGDVWKEAKAPKKNKRKVRKDQ